MGENQSNATRLPLVNSVSSLKKSPKAEVLAEREKKKIAKAKVSIEKAFEYFGEGRFEEFDTRLDEIGFWSDCDRVDFVRSNRESFSDGKKA